MRLDLDDEVTDAIVLATLKEHRKYANKNVKDLKKKKKLESYQEQDLGHNIRLAASLDDVIRYFGG